MQLHIIEQLKPAEPVMRQGGIVKGNPGPPPAMSFSKRRYTSTSTQPGGHEGRRAIWRCTCLEKEGDAMDSERLIQ